MRNPPHYAIIKNAIRLQCNLFLPDANNFLRKTYKANCTKNKMLKIKKKRGRNYL